jgi:hypothetical protein
MHRQIAEVDAADRLTEHGHEYIADQRGDDLAERGTNDHAHGQIDHAALHGEFFEFRS